MAVQEECSLMVDFETLSTKDKAVVLSIGIIVFNESGIKKEYYLELDVLEQVKMRRHIDPNTIAWWIRTNALEFLRLLQYGGHPVESMLLAIEEMRDEYKITKVWSRGCMDFHILNSFLKEPFPYYVARDVRTLDELGLTQKGNNHNALEDCRNQVAHVLDALKLRRSGDDKLS